VVVGQELVSNTIKLGSGPEAIIVDPSSAVKALQDEERTSRIHAGDGGSHFDGAKHHFNLSQTSMDCIRASDHLSTVSTPANVSKRLLDTASAEAPPPGTFQGVLPFPGQGVIDMQQGLLAPAVLPLFTKLKNAKNPPGNALSVMESENHCDSSSRKMRKCSSDRPAQQNDHQDG
jgi:hypothetical protein